MNEDDRNEGDSPPPPPLPSSLPPPLKTGVNKSDNDGDDDDGGSTHNDADNDDDDDGGDDDGNSRGGDNNDAGGAVLYLPHDVTLPSWVTNRLPLAVCQGCITEQKLRHTCSHSHDTIPNPLTTTTTSTTTSAILSHTDSLHRHVTTAHALHHEVATTDTQNHDVTTTGTLHHDAATTFPHRQQLEPETAETLVETEGQAKRKRNTWPRKRGRAAMIHVAYIFDADDDDNVQSIVVDSSRDYLLSADDSVCDGGRLAEKYSLTRAGSVHRIPRNSQQTLPPELETVRKGTPLYGQPDWWGDDSSPTSKRDTHLSPLPRKRDINHSPPSEKRGTHHSPSPGKRDTVHSPSPGKRDTVHSPTAEKRDINHSPSARKGDTAVSHGVSEDVSVSPSYQQGVTTSPPSGTTSPPSGTTSIPSGITSIPSGTTSTPSLERANVSGDEGSRSGEEVGVMEVKGSPALSFTVEFGDRKRTLRSGASLSQFVPPRLRHSLMSAHGRQDSKKATTHTQRPAHNPTAPVQTGGQTSPAIAGDSPPGRLRHQNDRASGVTSPSPVYGSVEHQDNSEKSRAVPKLYDLQSTPPTTPNPSSAKTLTMQSTTVFHTSPHPHTSPHTHTSFSDPRLEGWGQGSVMPDSPRNFSCDSLNASPSDLPVAPRQFAGASEDPEESLLQPQQPSGKGLVSVVQPQQPLSKGQASVARPQQSLSNGQVSVAQHQQPLFNGLAESDSVVHGWSGPRSSRVPMVKQKSLGKMTGLSSSDLSSGSTAQETEGSADLRVSAPPSPSEDAEDSVSEAGTYTIEAEEQDAEEERLARQQIDQVFGVDLNFLSFQRPIIDGWQEFPAPSRKTGERSGCEGTERDSRCGTPGTKELADRGDSSKKRGVSVWDRKDEVAPWVTQLTALTSPRRPSSSPSTTEGVRGQAEAEQGSSRKPPQAGGHRRRGGTGRRLPSVPSDYSPAGSDRSFRLRDANSPDSVTSTLSAPITPRTPVLDNGRGIQSPASSLRSGSRGSTDLRPNRGSGSPCGSEDSERKVVRRPVPKSMSAMARASLDSQLLLRKTSSVMEAMEIQMGFSRKDREITRSEVDLTPDLTMLTGEENSTSQATNSGAQIIPHSQLSCGLQTIAPSKATSVSSPLSRISLPRATSAQKPPITALKSTASGAGAAAAAGMLTRHNSLDLALKADGGKLSQDKSAAATESAGKGGLTIAKTNRAFALRRARADSTESKEVDRGRTSVTSSKTNRRSSSLHGTTRTALSEFRAADSGCKGDRRVRGKSATRDSTSSSRSRDRSVPRGDGAGHTQGQGRRAVTSGSVPSTIASRAKEKERDVHTPRSVLRASHKDLTLTGSSRGSHSQPGSRSGSPKSAEKLAWKRRKEYDPRKAVAEAKANKSKEKGGTVKTQSKQRLTRSLSLTNTAELSLATGCADHPDPSAHSPPRAEDLAARGQGIGQRGFLPFHSSLRTDHHTGSAQDQQDGNSPKTQDTNHSLHSPLTPLCRPSAFTPPLSQLPPSSPDLLSRGRRLVLVEVDYQDCAGGRDGVAAAVDVDSSGHTHCTDSSSPQTYNSLMVSSICQLSDKLKIATDRTVSRLREQQRLTATPSPSPSPHSQSVEEQTRGEIPAWHSANQELASVLRNMRRLQNRLHLIDQVLFPEDEDHSDLAPMSSGDRRKYLQEMDRIRTELAGFQPIVKPQSELSEPSSPEMAQLSQLLF